MSKYNAADLQDRTKFIEFLQQQFLPSGFSANVTARMNEAKLKLFIDMFDLAQKEGTSYDSNIVFEDVLEDFGRIFNEIQPILVLAERNKEVERPDEPLTEVVIDV